MAAVLATIGVLLWSRAAGEALLRLLRLRVPADARLPLSTGAGLSFAGTLVALVGLAGKLTPAWLLSAFTLALVLSALAISAIHPEPDPDDTPPIHPVWFYPAFALVTFLLFLQTFGPPMHLDVTLYHLALPKIFAREHAVVNVPSIVYSYFPMNAEMLYTIAMMTGSHVPAAAFHLAFGVLTSLLMLSFARRFLRHGAARVASLLYLAHPLVTLEVTTALVDAAVAFFVTASLFLFLEREGGNRRGTAEAAALFAGMAAAVKWTGGFYFAPIMIALAVRVAIDAEAPARRVFRLLLMAALVLLPPLVWLIRNACLIGDPVYPVMASMFHGRGLDVRLANNAAEIIRSAGYYHRTVSGFFSAPGSMLLSEWAIGGPLTPVFYVFIPFALLRGRSRAVWMLLAMGILGYVFWFAAMPLTIRLLLPVFPVYAFLAADGFAALCAAGPLSRNTARAALAVCFLVYFALDVCGRSGLVHDLRYLAAGGARKAILRREIYYYPTMEWMNRHLPPDADVLIAGALTPGYYLDRKYIMGYRGFQSVVRYERFGSVESMAKHLRALGVTHVLVPRNYYDGKPVGYFNWMHPIKLERNVVRDYFDHYLVPIHKDPAFIIYKVKSWLKTNS